MMPDTCPNFMGYVLHRYPCRRAGEVEDTIFDKREAPAPETGGRPNWAVSEVEKASRKGDGDVD